MSTTIAWQAWQDLRYALRTLRANPGFTVVAAVTMALGIGVNTALFTLINAVMFRPTPVGDPASLYETSAAPGEFLRYRQNCRNCAEVAAYVWALPALGDPGEGEIVHGNEVSSNYFRTMGVQPALGRFFDDNDDRGIGGNAVVLNYEFWKRRFQGDTALVGRPIRLGGREYIVAGIASPQFIGTMPLVAKFWTLFPRDRPPERVRILVRAKAGTSQRRIEDELTMLRRQLSPAPAGANPEQDRVRLQSRANLIPLNPATAALAGLLLGCVGLVLLIACANVANLVLARSAGRRREISVRLALGASRGRLLRQLVTESMVVSALGGALALLAASWTLAPLAALIQSRLPAVWGEWTFDLNPDLRVFAFTAVACVAAAFLFGFVPALPATSLDVSTGLKDGSNRGMEWSRSRLRSALVVVQVALCLVLLINAGLLARSLAHAYTDYPGFDAARHVIVQFDPGERQGPLAAQMLERVSSAPDVESAAAARMVPLLGSGHGSVSRRPDERGLTTGFNRVTASYFRVLGVPMVAGRTFTPEEERSNAQVAVLSEAAARKLFPGENPLARSVTLDGSLAGQPLARHAALVVGVARDARNLRLAELDAAFVYIPFDLSRPSGTVHYFVRARGEPKVLLPSLRRSATEMSRGRQLLVYPFDTAIGFQRLPAQAGSALSGILGLLAVLLASVGIYGVVSYSVSQRTREIGVRVALGATAGDVTRLIVGQGMRLVGAGVAAGAAGAIPLALLIRAVMPGVMPRDPLTFVAVPALLAVIALTAMWMPSRRASRLDPASALRYE